jgi:hypothetical protein
MPIGELKTVGVKQLEVSKKLSPELPIGMVAPADTKSAFMSEPTHGPEDLCSFDCPSCSDGWGDEAYLEEKSLKEAELETAKKELKEAWRSLCNTLFTGSAIATFMGFAIAVIGFIRFLSFKDVLTDLAIWILGLIAFGYFRRQR